MRSETESGFTSEPTVLSIKDEMGFSALSRIYESKSGRFQVFKARHFGRLIILKCPGVEFMNDSHVIAQLYKEFCIGFSIEHPGVCRSLALTTMLNGTPALEMEYCAGISLREMIDSGGPRLGAKQAELAVTVMLEALECIHKAGVIHRDIKPDNIIVDPCTVGVKIIDFGCADSPEYLLMKSPAGTHRYQRAKEGALRPVPSDDLYALGLTLAEMSGIVDGAIVQTRIQALSSELAKGRFAAAGDALQWWRTIRCRNRRLFIGKVVGVALLMSAGLLWLSSWLCQTDATLAGKIIKI